MDLRDPIHQQAEDLMDWLFKRLQGDSPPTPAVWEELSLEGKERAIFIREYWLPKMEDPVVHLPTLRVFRGTGAGAELVHPQERNGATAQPEPALALEPEPVETSPPFTAPERPNGRR